MAEIRIPIIVENKGKKAFKDVDKGVKGLTSNFKKLAGAAGIGLSTAAVINFGKQAAKAFIADEKAASQLALAVKNLGLGFETPRIEEFISQLAKASGVTDDQLRPSMQKLLQTTGSVSKSTELLTQALDVSRGSGVDFETVVNDLSMAYVGQTRGLKKYSLGLSQAELKTMSFADVQEKLSKQFTGANAAYLETYAGKMGILSNAAGEAQEIIGKGLVDSLSLLAGDGNSIQPLADSMLEFATYISDAILGVAKLIDKMKSIPGTQFVLDNQDFFRKYLSGGNGIIFRAIDELAKLGADSRAAAGMGGYPSSALGPGYVDPNDAARKAAEAAAAKRAKELAALNKKSLDTQKKSLALQKASKTLNLDAIGIEAALKGKISETDRLSLLLQKAILEGNATLATQLSDQLEAAIKRNNEIRLALLSTPKAPNPYEDWKIPAELLAYTAATLGVSAETVINAPESIGIGATDATQELIEALIAAAEAQRKADGARAEAEQGDVNIKITMPNGSDGTDGAKAELTNQALSGSFINVNRLGRFGAVATI